ncbi:MAG: ATP phosphoribosyltransferase regulatory subunit [Oscillospiraceae bacterium]|nr:ATP phosphoribosyltransferase regulatory subunit [Oscillospiraceae bacterium]
MSTYNTSNNFAKLDRAEECVLALRALYESFGYKKYRMNKFEEYSFYIANRKFLQNEQFISFTDMDGRLLALKPDITLSIVKNSDIGGANSRVYYDESVYRVSKKTGTYKESGQLGLEFLGRIDAYNIYEALYLANKSLETIDADYCLDVSHIGFVFGALGGLPLNFNDKNRVLDCLKAKNIPELAGVLDSAGATGEQKNLLAGIIGLGGKIGNAIPKAKALIQNKMMGDAVAELETVHEMLRPSVDTDKIRLDFSVLNDTEYYNGLLFNGYIKGVSEIALVGGRYDELLSKIGKADLQGIGFAINFDSLERFLNKPCPGYADTLILYSEKSDFNAADAFAAVRDAAMKEISEGRSVVCEKSLPKELDYGKLVDLR